MEGELFLANSAEEDILNKWNDTFKKYDMKKCLHELIEDQINQNPDKPAVRFEDKQICFAELNDRSNRCARYLRGLGAGPDSIVGVLMERSVEMVVALLAIIKAGGAYLPLDPTNPEERLQFMLEDAGVSVVLTQQKHHNLVSQFAGTKFCLDSEWDYLINESGDNLENITTPDNLAYVIYTSGSTGKPKGCMLPHKAICNRLFWMQDKYQLNDKDRVLQKTPYTFDVSVWEFFWPLLTGACLIMAKPEGHKDSNYLVDIIRKERITTCHFVPSMLRYFVSNVNVGKCESLRQVFASGEALPFDLTIDFKNKIAAKLHNLYGPTEAAVDVTYWECEERADKKVPIGKPISNIQLHILDSDLNRVPIGHEGELHIGGIGLARGYLNRPELTAEKFITDPFSKEPGARLYKTGDKARYLPDGNIEYLGRIDFQVKLRGNRIELGEIEAVLREHEALEEAAVLVKDEESGDPKLVAYVVPKNEMPPTKEIREFVKSKLPQYMVPNIVAPMESIPVTQHGKLDRGALPWPLKDRAGQKKKIVKAKTEPGIRETVSKEILDYFKKALDVTELKYEDDLFDLGATSLTMVRIIEVIHKHYGVTIPVEVFLDDPTVNAVIEYLCQQLEGQSLVHANSEQIPETTKEVPDQTVDVNKIAGQIIEYFIKIMGIDGLKSDDDLFDIGATSLTMVQVIDKIQQDYNITVPVEVFLDNPTVSGIADYVVQNLGNYQANVNENTNKDVSVNVSVNVNEATPTYKCDSQLSSIKTGIKDIDDLDTLIELNKVDFKESAYKKGAFYRNFVRKPISFNVFSKFLSLLKKETVDGEPKYMYPSAGGLNAVQTYLYIKEDAVEGVNQGIYYYHPEMHCLYMTDDQPVLDRSIFFEYDRTAYDNAGFTVFFIAQLDAIKPVYQDISPMLVTLDAGYMGQLLVSRQSEYNLGLCPVGGVDFDRVSDYFKLGEGHRFIHCILAGVPDGIQSEYEGNKPGRGVVEYLQKTGTDISGHLQDYNGAKTFASFLDIDWNVFIKNMKYLNKEEHDRFHEQHLNIRRFSGEEKVLTLAQHSFKQYEYKLRSSKRDYTENLIPLEQFSKFLSLLKQENKNGNSCYLYPSITGTFGIQAYLYIKNNRIEGVPEGIYYYHPVKHALVLVTSKLTTRIKSSCTPFNRRHYDKSAFNLFLIADLDAIKPVYKEDSLYFAMLEAGYMGQLLMDKQAEFDIGICPIGGLTFDKIRPDFKLKDGQVLIHSFTCGGFELEIPEGREYLEINRGELETKTVTAQDIAIVGISGRYSGASNLDEYWEILKTGKSSIREFPESRKILWGLGPYENKSNDVSLKAGYMEDIDCFDSLLFNISPSEAGTMDPQERLFLEVIWETLENAGYNAENLMRNSGRIGVFVGAMWNDYQNQGINAAPDTKASRASAFHSSMANRISYFFNFSGPSIAINTSCSSAMTAIHFACESIKRRECSAALVGGVNLITHPYHHDLLVSLDLLSKDGECRPFGAEATGWLAGEGIGAILLKPLEDAIRDRDYIHGIIKGTAISHSGKTMRFGAPSITTQAESIQRAITASDIPVESISYIEAAAPGASIADASEINAVKKVFKEHYDQSSPCFIGSVKGSIGHLESASAMSQLAKVLLQMKYRYIVPTLNCIPINPLLQIEGSGLKIVDELKPWENPDAGDTQTATGKKLPLRALINAFGATGSGGHILVEQYVSEEVKQQNIPQLTLVPISAATDDQLKQLAVRIYEYLTRSENLSLNISDIGFTLQTGRMEMDERLAIVAENAEVLTEKLSMFLKGEVNIDGIYRGTVVPDGELNVIKNKDDLNKIAEQWVQGASIDWNKLTNGNERRVPLPTYPFKKERHWVNENLTIINVQNVKTGSNGLLEKIEDYLKKAFSAVSEIPVSVISVKAPLEKYGISSLMITELNRKLEKDFGGLSKTLFFEYQTIHELAKYFLENHRDRSMAVLDFSEPLDSMLSDNGNQNMGALKYDRNNFLYGYERNKRDFDVAIVGLSGRYPKAKTIADLWENLINGVDCITEIPIERWDYQKYYAPQKQTQGKMYSKWGGFLEDVDKFDPLFFNISPKEAQMMDPQERLFLETVWHTFEDAGYNRQSLKTVFGGRVGVFAGVMYGEYPLLNENELVFSFYGSIANRVSYFFDFNGPSMAIDTMCSSSITTIHLAVESIKRGECAVAIAGGVSLSIHPGKYLLQSQLTMSSTDGRCRSFGEGGDGFVPGEGVGAVLLKPLPQALLDGDHIYGVIKGTAINHGGKTNGYLVPNPTAQSNLILDALEKAKINPRTISYVEAHGTGTSLGDPIEITGLSKSFNKYTNEKQYCPIGSVKSNIGHLESAAGIAAVTKVLLQLKHKKIVPSLHSEQLNSNINFEDTPFWVQQELADWNRPVIEVDGESKTYPRVATVSSFGAGGANAHIIIEEYEEPLRKPETHDHGVKVILLSARDDERLREQVRQLLNAFENQQFSDSDLNDIAYTLQVGREAMEARLAVLAGSIKDLEEKLKGYMEGRVGIENLYYGQSRQYKDTMAVFTADEEMQEAIDKWILRKKYEKLLELWVKGLDIDWNAFYGETQPRRISLPTYPFIRERYWISEKKTKFIGDGISTASLSTIHPLLHQNTSDLLEQRFSSTFTGDEFFLADHVVKGMRVLPGVACLEMARVAVEKAAGPIKDSQTGICLKNVVWIRPITVSDEPIQVNIGIIPEENGEITYEIYSEYEKDNNEPVIHSQGSALLSRTGEAPTMDIKALQARCSQNILSADHCYKAFTAMGIDYGPGHQGIKKVYVGKDQVLAELILPAAVYGTDDEFVLHPSIMDSALQASIALLNEPDKGKPALPFALEEVDILGRCGKVMWALIRHSENSSTEGKLQKLDIDLCDEQGNICIRMKGFSSRILEGEVGSIGSSEVEGTLMLQPCWREPAISYNAPVPDYAQQLVFLCGQEDILKERIESEMSNVRCLVLQSLHSIEESFESYTVQVFEEIQNIFKSKPNSQVLVQVVVTNQGEQQMLSGLSGFLKTARLENPKLIGQLIEIEQGEDSLGIIQKLKENSRNLIDHHIRYQNGKGLTAGWTEVEISRSEVCLPWKDRGIYLITGGTGGLGLIIAREISQRVKDAVIILTGRSPLSKDKKSQLKKLAAFGAQIKYQQVDVTQSKAVETLIQEIQKDFGRLDGIMHCAGIIRDNFIIKKTRDELIEVLLPKVRGLVNLDQASKDMPLDFFILFSSASGVVGNPGQSDYAAANAFMDAYAGYRNDLVLSNQRHGRTLSMIWPLWQEGGMQVDEEIMRTLKQKIGLTAMQTSNGIEALYHGLASGKAQVMVMEGDLQQLRTVLLEPGRDASATPVVVEYKAVPAVANDLLQEKVESYFKKLLSSVINLPASRIESDAPLEKYGIDSVMVMQMTNKLESTFGSLSKTLFFEYQDIRALTGYFINTYRERVMGLIGVEEDVAVAAPISQNSVTVTPPINPVLSSRRRRFVSQQGEYQEDKGKGSLEVAIIGVSGRYPQANNLREFWRNLVDGRDCITEIPKERWDYNLHFDENYKKPGQTQGKWGGFIDGVDKFDSRFFNISRREAELMDPQERLFLQCIYETMEDAGYTRQALGMQQDLGSDNSVGVYVGVMYEEYQLYGAQEQAMGRPVALHGIPSSIANRVSYFCNFHGPSMAIDTMCSSSLTAIHLACQGLQKGDCDLAVAGGVNVSIHPNKYLILGQSGFMSSKGRCESFGQGGDGYVPGEGVGAVLLKPLFKAIADGDHIYGVIKATSINHGGKTNGYTVPNPNAQADVISRAFKEAGINPRIISYIEAHGTGTSLGDPIEIAGLTKSFQEYTQETQFCAIGSVKSNIGHCESAAGIAAVTKVLLQLKNRRLVPNLHSRALNPNIDFSSSPFVVQQELAEWKRPLVNINGETREYPRIAGISSFGAGGSNGHIIIEEYVPKDLDRPKISITSQNPAIIVLSAKKEEQLREQAYRLLEFIQEQQLLDSELADVAFTLQVGREAMGERLAVIVESVKELEDKLKGFIEGREGIDELYRGQVKQNKDTLAIFAADEDMAITIEAWITKRKYSKLLDLWVKGLVFDWNKLYTDFKPRRISLPTYPFSRERHWVPQIDTNSGANIKSAALNTDKSLVFANVLHPLLHQNTSDFSGQRYSSTFTGHEFFLTDHKVKGQMVLPGVASLEMARGAVCLAAGLSIKSQSGIRLKQVVWTRPLIVNQPVKVNVRLFPEDNNEITYEIQSEHENENMDSIVYSQGSVVLSSSVEVPVLDIEVLQAQCGQSVLSSNQCYEAYRAWGIDYGPAHQGIEKIYVGQGQVLAKLSLPSTVSDTLEQYVLHPSLMDSALQAVIGLMISSADSMSREPIGALKSSLPFAIQELEIFKNCTSQMWALVRYSDSNISAGKVQKFDIDVCDNHGNVGVRIKGFSSRETGNPETSAEQVDVTTMLTPVWDSTPVEKGPVIPYSTDSVVIIGGNKNTRKTVQQHYPKAKVLEIKPKDTIDKIMKKLEAHGLIDHIVWIAPYNSLQSLAEESLIEDQNQGVIQCFRMIKSLLGLGYGNKELGWSVITIQSLPIHRNDSINPTHASLHGLIGSMAKEYPKWQVRIVDLEAGRDWPLSDIFSLPAEAGNAWAYRGQEWYREKLIPVHLPKSDQPLYRHGGVYVVIGGAGGIGEAWTEYMIRTYQAQIIWIGRREREAVQDKLDRLSDLGPAPMYIAADATDQEALCHAYNEIKQHYSRIHGVIHSAIRLLDQSLAKMDEERFKDGISAKVDVTVRMAQIFKEEALDFVMFFSSMIAFTKPPGQSNYASGCTFKDAFAHQLAREWSCTVKVMNWGYWGSIGIVASKDYQERMARAGVGSIEPPEAMEALESLLAGPLDQVGLIKTTKSSEKGEI